MTQSHTDPGQNHHVSVRYGDGQHSFWLARGTTFGELALHVDVLHHLHSAAPLAIEVAMAVPKPASPALVPDTAH